MPVWTFKGKHQGKDINDVPTDYLEWAVKDSKNPEARDMARRALEFREGSARNSQKSSGQTSPRRYINQQQPVSKDFLDMMARGMALWLSVQTGQSLSDVQEYLRSGNAPWHKPQEPERQPELTDMKFDPFANEREGDDMPEGFGELA
jgi:hypothetical protein